jgi:hypothetical protein
MLGMAVLLVVGELERICEMHSSLRELALHGAFARPHLGRDVRDREVEVLAEHGDLALAARERRQRAYYVDALSGRSFELR